MIDFIFRLLFLVIAAALGCYGGTAYGNAVIANDINMMAHGVELASLGIIMSMVNRK